MLNQSGVTNQKYGAPRQILANVELQASVGCIVPQDMGVDVSGKKIAKAGTPIKIDLLDINKVVTAATSEANAVLLHDVDVTKGNANGTALYFGIVNLNRVEADVATKLQAVTNFGNVMLLKV